MDQSDEKYFLVLRPHSTQFTKIYFSTALSDTSCESSQNLTEKEDEEFPQEMEFEPFHFASN